MSALDNFNLDDIPGAENVVPGSDLHWDLAQRYLREKRREKKAKAREEKKRKKSQIKKSPKKKIYSKPNNNLKPSKEETPLTEYEWQVKTITNGTYRERKLGNVTFYFGQKDYSPRMYFGLIPGVKLNHKELGKLSEEQVHWCGRLREIHILNNRLTGLCALTENFSLCKYPQIIKKGWPENCALENEFHRQAVANYQRELAEEKNRHESIAPIKFNKLEPIEYHFKLVKRNFVYQRVK
jgi:hypothetical protein